MILMKKVEYLLDQTGQLSFILYNIYLSSMYIIDTSGITWNGPSKSLYEASDWGKFSW